MASATIEQYDNQDEVVKYFISYINSYQSDTIDTNSLQEFIRNPDIDLESYCYFYFNKISIYMFHKILLEVIEKCLYLNSHSFTFGKVLGIMTRYVIDYHNTLLIKNGKKEDLEIFEKLKKFIKYSINQIITTKCICDSYDFTWNIQLQLAIFEPFHKKVFEFYLVKKDALLLENIRIVCDNTIMDEEPYFNFSDEFILYSKVVIKNIFHFM